MSHVNNPVTIKIFFVIALLISFYPGIGYSNEGDLEVITLLGDEAKALPEFELVDHNNQALVNTHLQGKWNLMFFGYTHCPDVCPTTLSEVSRVFNALNDSQVRDKLNVYFVSVDPERDNPEHLAKYMSYFNPEFIGATADIHKLKILTSALGISHRIKKKSDSDINYTVSHSGFVVLIDPQVRYSGLYFSSPKDVEAVARDINRLVNPIDG